MSRNTKWNLQAKAFHGTTSAKIHLLNENYAMTIIKKRQHLA